MSEEMEVELNEEPTYNHLRHQPNCNCIRKELGRLAILHDTDLVVHNYLYLGFSYKKKLKKAVDRTRSYWIDKNRKVGDYHARFGGDGKDFKFCPFCGEKYKEAKK